MRAAPRLGAPALVRRWLGKSSSTASTRPPYVLLPSHPQIGHAAALAPPQPRASLAPVVRAAFSRRWLAADRSGGPGSGSRGGSSGGTGGKGKSTLSQRLGASGGSSAAKPAGGHAADKVQQLRISMAKAKAQPPPRARATLGGAGNLSGRAAAAASSVAVSDGSDGTGIRPKQASQRRPVRPTDTGPPAAVGHVGQGATQAQEVSD